MARPERTLIQAAPALRRALLAWFAQYQRSMPWRSKPTAYRTVVSELMCQQTQIATVIPYFERWVKQWPDFKALAKAEEAAVLKLWAGLGYYSRARNLLGLAKQVTALPALPRTAVEWQEFKGVGPYTAAAIASIAYGEPVAVVDGNVVRVLSRLTGHRAQLKDAASATKQFTGLADALVDPKQPGDFNQAMMELGALVCRKAAPDCAKCPVAKWCDARRQGDAEKLPRFVSKARQTAVVERALVMRSGKLLLRRYGRDSRRLVGMAEIPEMVSLGVKPSGEPTLVRRRTIGTISYEERLHVLVAAAGSWRRWTSDPELEWVATETLEQAALTGPHLRWLREWLSLSGPKVRGKRP
ncbi:MAG: A/G-specific adenine glycosylase [Opitutales bacterium]|nr:MAG: A/G-specific adenine glycosylase [Opitutales bacterium]